jgi:apolipoprotein N-acyltransferase
MFLPLLSPLENATALSGELKVAAVQGNAKAGLFSREPRGTILENHIEATLTGVGDSEVDLIVWPENASDVNPLGDANARAKIENIANAYDADFVFGTITERNGEVFNSTVLWDSKLGPTDYYDKKRPVPFAEYVPDREFWRSLAPELIDLVPRGYSFGVRDGIYQLREAVAGTLICFEIAEDDIPRDLASQGAELILSQTNNADFGYSDETWQQSAIAKLRAIETGRTVINISTVGHSAIYLFDGSIQAELPWYTAGAMVETVQLRQGITPGSALGGWFDLINALVGMSFIAFSVGFGRKR